MEISGTTEYIIAADNINRAIVYMRNAKQCVLVLVKGEECATIHQLCIPYTKVPGMRNCREISSILCKRRKRNKSVVLSYLSKNRKKNKKKQKKHTPGEKKTKKKVFNVARKNC